ncbi:MAG: dihydroorotase [Acidimicrobiia bacterium]
MIAIRNGSVLTSGGVLEIDVLIEGGRVTRVGGDFDAEDNVDVNGAWVGPGFVDLHVHFREPGQEWKEDISTGSRAAAVGGFTAVVTMPNTEPAIDAGHLARYVLDRGRQVGLCEIVPAGALTMGRAGEKLSHLDEMWEAGVRIYSDDGASVADAGLLRLAMEYLAEKGGVVAQHAEDAGLADRGHMHEGAISSKLGMRGLPAIAEEVVIARDLALTRLTGVRYHCQHISTARSVGLLRQAREEGLAVTAEVTPHHLTFDHQRVLSLDPVYKMYPPLRPEEDVAEVRKALQEGVIDAVATDHAPHAAFETEVPFEEAPRGVIGLETAAAALHTAIKLDQTTFFDRLSIAPARIAGLERQGVSISEGSPANLVVFEPDAAWTPSSFVSKAQNSPFRDRELRGRVTGTIFGGFVTHHSPLTTRRS